MKQLLVSQYLLTNKQLRMIVTCLSKESQTFKELYDRLSFYALYLNIFAEKKNCCMI